MRLLIVCKGDFERSEENFEKNRAYIFDQYQLLKTSNIQVKVFFIQGKGILPYILAIPKLKGFLKKEKFDLVHAHYGYCGLVAGLASNTPVVVTYHGTDITEKISKMISSLSILLSNWNIFVSQKLHQELFFSPKSHYSILPCGVNLDVFYPIEKIEACRLLGWNPDKRRILFSSAFDNPIKNYSLAKESFEKLDIRNLEMIELKNRNRQEVSWMLNASDVLLLTSFSEGSTQIIKEALACGFPIISTDVGDVKEQIGELENCRIVGYDSFEIAGILTKIILTKRRTERRKKIQNLDNQVVIKKLLDVYLNVLNKEKRL